MLSRAVASYPRLFALFLSIIAGRLTVIETKMTSEDLLPIHAGQSTSFRCEPLEGPAGKAGIGCAPNLPAEESAFAAAGRI